MWLGILPEDLHHPAISVAQCWDCWRCGGPGDGLGSLRCWGDHSGCFRQSGSSQIWAPESLSFLILVQPASGAPMAGAERRRAVLMVVRVTSQFHLLAVFRSDVSESVMPIELQ
jgi:hypothetical protein